MQCGNMPPHLGILRQLLDMTLDSLRIASSILVQTAISEVLKIQSINFAAGSVLLGNS